MGIRVKADIFDWRSDIQYVSLKHCIHDQLSIYTEVTHILSYAVNISPRYVIVMSSRLRVVHFFPPTAAFWTSSIFARFPTRCYVLVQIYVSLTLLFLMASQFFLSNG